LPVDENHPDYPVTIYDLHKLMAEGYLKHYTAQDVVRGAVLRLANVYGPGAKSSSADRGVLNLMIQKALKGETLTVYGDGNYMRDFVYVEDVAHAFLEAGAKIDGVNGQHFVIGSGQGHTIAEAVNLVAERVALKTGQRVPVIHVEPPAALSQIETRNFVADTTRFSYATGWKARVSLVEGIDRTIDYLFTTQDKIS
jgi:nucleoside-diphosphate-sugar epimerase